MSPLQPLLAARESPHVRPNTDARMVAKEDERKLVMNCSASDSTRPEEATMMVVSL